MVIVDEFLILFLLRGPFAGGDVTHTIGSTHQGGDEGRGRRPCARVGRGSGWGWGRREMSPISLTLDTTSMEKCYGIRHWYLFIPHFHWDIGIGT